MPTKHGDTLRTQSSSEETPNNNSLIERVRIDGTPFVAIGQENKWFLVLGNYRITEPTETYEETVQKLDTNMWDIIGTLICVLQDKFDEEKNVKNKGAN